MSDSTPYLLSPISRPLQWHELVLAANQAVPAPIRNMLAAEGAFDRYISSPFVQDTLFPLAGGTPSHSELRGTPQWPYSSQTLGAVEGEPDNLKFILYRKLFDPSAGHSVDDLASHEAGHMFSARSVAPNIIQAVKAQWNPQVAAIWGQNVRNPEELVAQTFSRAIDFLRNSSQELAGTPNPHRRLQELQETERIYSPPGTDLMIQYLLGTPFFKEHPINSIRFSK